MKSTFPWLSAFGCLVVFLTLSGNSHYEMTAASAAPELDDLFKDMIVARGKGFSITRSDLDKAIITAKATRAGQGNPMGPSESAELEGQMLNRMITTAMLLNKASAEQRKKASPEAGRTLAEMQQQHPSLESFERQLMTSGMTLDYLKQQILEQAIVKTVIDDALRNDYLVPDADAREFYQQNLRFFTAPEQVRLRNIYFPLLNPATREPVSSEERDKILREAESVRQKALAGYDFQTLVRDHSKDGITKQRGGEVILVKGGQDKALEDAAFALEPEGISPVVFSVNGYHILKCIEKIPSTTQPFSEAAQSIRNQLETEHVELLLPDFLQKLRDESSVEILLP